MQKKGQKEGGYKEKTRAGGRKRRENRAMTEKIGKKERVSKKA